MTPGETLLGVGFAALTDPVQTPAASCPAFARRVRATDYRRHAGGVRGGEFADALHCSCLTLLPTPIGAVLYFVPHAFPLLAPRKGASTRNACL